MKGIQLVDTSGEGGRYGKKSRRADWLPEGTLNIAHECIDRHAQAQETIAGYAVEGKREKKYTPLDS